MRHLPSNYWDLVKGKNSTFCLVYQSGILHTAITFIIIWYPTAPWWLYWNIIFLSSCCIQHKARPREETRETRAKKLCYPVSSEFWSIALALRVEKRKTTPHFTSLPERGNDSIKYFIFSSSNLSLSRLQSWSCAPSPRLVSFINQGYGQHCIKLIVLINLQNYPQKLV